MTSQYFGTYNNYVNKNFKTVYLTDVYTIIILTNNYLYLLYILFQIKIDTFIRNSTTSSICSVKISSRLSCYKIKDIITNKIHTYFGLCIKCLCCKCDKCKCYKCKSNECMCNHIININNGKSDNCCICLEPIKTSNICRLKCQHILHVKCYLQLIKTSNLCPLCREPLNPVIEV